MRRDLPQSPGILSPEAYRDREAADVARRSRRRRARAGGLASGRVRRANAKGRRVPHRRTRELALDETGGRPIPQARFPEFKRRYYSSGPGNQQGLMTCWLIYRQDLKVARRETSAQTTGPQRVRGLELAFRPRCKRTVQRSRRRIVRMGLMRYGHVKRKGFKKGERDSIRITPIRTNVTLLEEQQRQGLRPYLSLLKQQKRQKRPSVEGGDGGRSRRRGDTPNSGHREGGGASPPAPQSGAGDELEGSVTPSELSPWARQLMLRLGLSP